MDAKKLTDEEVALMFSLAKRYAETELDQFEIFKFDTKFGKVFFSLSQGQSRPDDGYIDVTGLIENYNNKTK